MSGHAFDIFTGFILIGVLGALLVAFLRTGKTSRTATYTYEGSSWTVAAGGDVGVGHGHGYGDHGGDWGGDCGGHDCGGHGGGH